MVTTAGCDICNKSSLSLFLLRPSPVANNKQLAPLNGEKVVADASAIAGLIPKVTHSRFALRVLRAGYVHVYIPNPPPGVKEWLVFRVTAEADLIPESHAKFGQLDSPMTCGRTGHIATGMKVLSIPQAHRIPEIWLAYSANLWNDTLRKSNKADPAVMQKVSLQGSSPNTFQPTEAKLKAQVLECALNDYSIAGYSQHEYPFVTLQSSVPELASNLQRAAAKHPKTAGKELAVVLRDPVGIAAELSDLRVIRNEIMKADLKAELAKPKVAHAMNSSNAILSLRKSIFQEEDLASYDRVSKVMLKSRFDPRMWSPGTKWMPLSAEDREDLVKRASADSGWFTKFKMLPPEQYKRSDMGRVIFPDHEKRLNQSTQEHFEDRWSKLAGYYSEEERAGWVKDFDKKLRDKHYSSLEQYELDWITAKGYATTYFKRHFDQASCPIPRNGPIDSIVFAQEHSSIYVPGPFTNGPVMKQYIDVLDKPLDDDEASVLRSLVGNKLETIRLLNINLTGDPAAVENGGMRDKTFDLLKGFSELEFMKGTMNKHRVFGHTLAFYSIGILTALTSAGLSFAARETTQSELAQKIRRKLLAKAFVQRALECAVHGALKGPAPNMPVLITMAVSADEALAIMKARPGQIMGTSKSKLKHYRKTNTKVPLTLLTDTDALKAANGDLATAAKSSSGATVKMGKAATAIAQAPDGSVLKINRETFVRLYADQASTAATAATQMRSMLEATNGSVGAAVVKSLGARLAIASMLVQTIGLHNALDAAKAAKTDEGRLEAELSQLDSVFGFLGGAFSLWSLASEIDISRRLGASALEMSGKLAALKVAAALTGVAGGALNAIVSAKKSEDQMNLNNDTPAALYGVSAFAFGLTGLTSLFVAGGELSTALVARTVVTNALIQGLAARAAAGGLLATVGGVAITASGLGVVLLGIGIAAQVGAIMLTPNDLQVWLGRSYFGRDGGVPWDSYRDDMFPKGDWKAEKDALDKLIESAQPKKE